MQHRHQIPKSMSLSRQLHDRRPEDASFNRYITAENVAIFGSSSAKSSEEPLRYLLFVGSGVRYSQSFSQRKKVVDNVEVDSVYLLVACAR